MFQEIGVKAVVKNFSTYMSQIGSMQNATQKMSGFLKTGLKVGAVAGAAAIGFSIKAYADFDAAMTESLAIMGDVDDAMRNKMAKAARQMAKETTFSATDAAKSYFYLASAGLSAQESIKDLPVVAKFAQAGMFDMAEATTLLADAQSALGLRIRDDAVANMQNMIRVSDVLTKANQMANANIQQFSEALTNRAGAALKMVGKDIEEGVAVLAAFADQGIKGAEAGTRLDIVLRDLQTKAIVNKDVFDKLGVAVFDSRGEMNNLGDIIGQLENLLSGMSDETKKATLLQMGFADRSVSSILALMGMSDEIHNYETALRSAGGATEEVAQKQLQTFNAQLNLLMSELTDVAIELGSKIVPSLVNFIKVIREEWIPAIKDQLVPLLASLVPTIAALAAVTAVWAGSMITAYAPIIALMAILAGLGAAFFLIEERTHFFSEKALPALRDFASGAKKALDDTIKIIKNFVDTFQKHWDTIKTFIMPVLNFIKTQVETRIQSLKSTFKLIIDLIHGDWKAAWQDFQNLIKSVIDNAISPFKLAWQEAKAALDIIWGAIASGVEGMVNGIIGALNVFLGALEATFNAMIGAYNATIGRLPGVSDIDEISLHIGKITLAAGKAAKGFDAVGESLKAFNTQVAKGQAAELDHDIQRLKAAAGDYASTADGASQSTQDLTKDMEWLDDQVGGGDGGGGDGGATGAMNDAAKAALLMASSLELTDAMVRQATVTEFQLKDAIAGSMEQTVKRENILTAEIGILKQQKDALDTSVEGNDILAEAIQTTIDSLQRQIDAVDNSSDRLVLFGDDVIGPVSAAIRDMNDAINEQISALDAMMSVQTAEEAALEAQKAGLEYQIELIDQQAGQTQELTGLEQKLLDAAKGRLPTRQEELEVIQETIDALTRKKDEEENLSRKEEKALEDAKARRDELEAMIKADEDLIKRLETKTQTETEAGKAAREHTEDLQAQLDTVNDSIENIQAEKKARKAELDAMAQGRPTMDDWKNKLYEQAVETGLLGGEIENIPPLLGDWWRANGTMAFEIARTQNHLLLAQRQFVSNSTTEAGNWANAWITAASEIVKAIADAGGSSTPAGTNAAEVEGLQHGGYIRKGGLVWVHRHEMVLPAELARDMVLRPRVEFGPPTRTRAGDFNANISVTTKDDVATEIERTMRKVAFGSRISCSA